MLGQMEDAAPRKEISNEWVLIIGGNISIIFGVVLVANPAAGAPMLRAYFQYHWNDAWGWGAGSPPLLVDISRDGRTIHALVHPTRNGYLYLLERTTGAISFI